MLGFLCKSTSGHFILENDLWTSERKAASTTTITENGLSCTAIQRSLLIKEFSLMRPDAESSSSSTVSDPVRA